MSIFLIVLSAAGEDHLPTVWRVCFGFGIVLPVTVFFFRLRMMSSKLYRKGAIKRECASTCYRMDQITEIVGVRSSNRPRSILAHRETLLEGINRYLWRMVCF